MKKLITICAVTAAMTVAPAMAETVKVGFMTTLSGGAGIIGKQMQNGVELAMQHKSGKLGGMDAASMEPSRSRYGQATVHG